MATVPAPPAVTVKAPWEFTVPAKDPAVPAPVDNWLLNALTAPTEGADVAKAHHSLTPVVSRKPQH